MELFWRRQRHQWENYVHGSGHDLCVVDGEIYELVRSARDQRCPSGRRGEVLKAVVTREVVDKHPEVARLRNRLDDWGNYAPGGTGAESQGSWKHRLALASRMQLAQELGYPSYIDSFRSIDPVYVHNYVVADRVAERTIEYLEDEYGDQVERWGGWLASHYYGDGRGRSLLEKIGERNVSSWLAM